MTKGAGRWTLACAAVLMQVCLGIIYTWSVFRGPLEQHYGWSKSISIAPYRWSILFFTLAMIVAGFWQDRKGPRLVGSVGGILLATGCLLAGLFGDTPMGLNVSYGMIAGLGVGFAYVTPIATCVKWFPDKRGFVVGLAVMGFGLGSLLFAPLLEALLGKDPALYAVTIPRAFYVLAAIFFVVVTGCAQMYRVPPKGWRPEGWSPVAASGMAAADCTPRMMLSTGRFYVLWIVYFLGSAIGLTAIAESAPLVKELAGASAVMTGGMALGVMSLFNGLGRLGWGTASDLMSRNRLVISMFTISALTCGLLLPHTRDFWRVLAGLCAVGFCYGGYLALMPALAAEYFGAERIGTNYGLLFTAWGAAGFTLPAVVANLRDKQPGYDPMFYLLSCLAVAGILIGFFLRGKPTPAVSEAAAG